MYFKMVTFFPMPLTGAIKLFYRPLLQRALNMLGLDAVFQDLSPLNSSFQSDKPASAREGVRHTMAGVDLEANIHRQPL